MTSSEIKTLLEEVADHRIELDQYGDEPIHSVVIDMYTCETALTGFSSRIDSSGRLKLSSNQEYIALQRVSFADEDWISWDGARTNISKHKALLRYASSMRSLQRELLQITRH